MKKLFQKQFPRIKKHPNIKKHQKIPQNVKEIKKCLKMKILKKIAKKHTKTFFKNLKNQKMKTCKKKFAET